MTKVLSFAVGVFLVAQATSAFAQSENPQIRKEIEAVYLKWDKMVAKQDVHGLLAMLDKSFVQTDRNSKVTYYPQVKQQVLSMPMIAKNCKSHITIHEIGEQGNEVVAWITMKVTFQARKGSGWEQRTHTGRYAETLRRINGQWKFVASQEFPPG